MEDWRRAVSRSPERATPPAAMTVFLAFAAPDLEVAQGLEAFLERRGQFVELDDGQTALRPVGPSDVLVLLLSKDFIFSPMRLRLEQRALDAWAEGRLIVVRLDKGLAPVGLRDLPALDASFAAQREFKWQELANAIREKLRAPARTDAAPPAPPPPSRKASGLWGVLGVIVLALPGLAALVASAAIWLVNRIGPTPGGLSELRRDIDALGVRYGLSAGVAEWLFLAAMALTLCVGLWMLARAIAPPRRRPETSAQAPAPEPEQAREGATFVSYARANQTDVLPLVEAAQALGRQFWLDQQGISSGDGWAGEIVRAIRGAGGVVVMCSKAAFESDHVKREVYLADRYHKRLLPVYLEPERPPEDFEYFFAAVQSLNLFETPEAERAAALLKALGANA